MNVNQVYEVMKYIINKNQQGYLSPADFNTCINNAQREFFDYLVGEYQKYQPGRPIPTVQFGQNETIKTTLAPLVYNVMLTVNPVTGIAPFPYDFEFVDAMWSVYNHYRIRFTNQDRLWSKYHSVIDPVAANPLYLMRNEGIQFYPENIGLARMSYLRTPPPIIWGESRDFNDRPVWNPATSQNPIWTEADMNNIISRALKMVGVNLGSQQISQYANEIKELGQ